MLGSFLPSTIQLGTLEISLYGLLLGIGALIIVNALEVKYKEKISIADFIIVIASTLLGARTLYLLHNIPEIVNGQVHIFSINSGGLALFGGIIGLLISIYFLFRNRKDISVVGILDILFLWLPISQSIGRLGNLINNELYGSPTNLPWKLYIPPNSRVTGYEHIQYYHPTFLYEIVLNILSFIFLNHISKKRKIKTGTISLLYFLNYGIIRVYMNSIRLDGEYFMGLETSEALAIIGIVVAVVLLIKQYMNKKNQIKLAEIVSLISNGFLTMVLPIFILVLSHKSLSEFLYIFLPSIIGPMAIYFILRSMGKASDINISKREQRPLFSSLMSILFLGIYLLSYNLFSADLTTSLLVLLITTVFFTLISTFWKISGHMTYLLFMIVSLNAFFNEPRLLYLYILIPIVAWSRVILKQHTNMQVIIGTLTAFIISFGLYYWV